MSTDPRVAEAMKLAETYVLADVSWHTLPGNYEMEDAERCEDQMFMAKQALEDYLAEQFANLEDALAMVRNSADHRQAEISRLTAELEEARKDAGAPLDYLQGHQHGLEWAAGVVEMDDPRTGDWRYDDRHELAAAIRKGPEMPPPATSQVDKPSEMHSQPVDKTDFLQEAVSALRSIADNTCCDGCQEAARVARTFLDKSDAAMTKEKPHGSL